MYSELTLIVFKRNKKHSKHKIIYLLQIKSGV